MRIEGLSQQPKVTQTRQKNTAVRAKKGEQRPSDVVEISNAPDIGELNAQAKVASTGNEARIEEIKARVQSGYYDSRQVREQIADAVLGSDGMREVVSDIAQVQTAKGQMADVPDVREERVEEARQRVNEGFYETRSVRQETATRILDEMA